MGFIKAPPGAITRYLWVGGVYGMTVRQLAELFAPYGSPTVILPQAVPATATKRPGQRAATGSQPQPLLQPQLDAQPQSQLQPPDRQPPPGAHSHPPQPQPPPQQQQEQQQDENVPGAPPPLEQTGPCTAQSAAAPAAAAAAPAAAPPQPLSPRSRPMPYYHAFLAFEGEEDAAAAVAAVPRGAPWAAAGGRKLVLQFADVWRDKRPVPRSVATSTNGLGVPGLMLLLDFITRQHEEELLAAVAAAAEAATLVAADTEQEAAVCGSGGGGSGGGGGCGGGVWESMAKRRVQHYGYRFDYATRNVDLAAPLGPLPPWAADVAERIGTLPQVAHPIDQLTVNEYEPGVGLAPHVDTHSAFTGPIISLSLGSHTVMEMRRGEVARPLLLPPRSLLIMGGESRYAWQHYIPHRVADLVDGQLMPRTHRVSLTFRKVRGFPCGCAYPDCCDSQQATLPPTRISQLQLPEPQQQPHEHYHHHLDHHQQQQQQQQEQQQQQLVPAIAASTSATPGAPWSSWGGCGPCPTLGAAGAEGLTGGGGGAEDEGGCRGGSGGCGGGSCPRGEDGEEEAGANGLGEVAADGGQGGSPWEGRREREEEAEEAQEASSRWREEEEEAKLAALEAEYVHKVYDAIAPHFSSTRFAIWPRVRAFIESLPPGALVADVGCGNGKYFGVRQDLAVLGSDISAGLVAVAAQRLHPPGLPPSAAPRAADALIADALRLPYRPASCDGALCIAVLHHLSSPARRVRLLRQLLRVLRPGGRALVTVWAIQQEDPAKTTAKWKRIPAPDGGGGGACPKKRTDGAEVVERRREGEEAALQGGQHGGHEGVAESDGAAAAAGARGGVDYFVPWHLPFHRTEAARAAKVAREATKPHAVQPGSGPGPAQTPGRGSAAAGGTHGQGRGVGGGSGCGGGDGGHGSGDEGRGRRGAAPPTGGEPKIDESKGAVIFQRYYHLFEELELRALTERALAEGPYDGGCSGGDDGCGGGGVEEGAETRPWGVVEEVFYDRSNWCVVFRRER